jgi:AcrR family transcriptional regulator
MHHSRESNEKKSNVVKLLTSVRPRPSDDNSPADAQQSNPHIIEKESEGIDRHRLIMEAAERLFGRFGFQKTRVADIARELHMSPSNVYRYFARRSEINAAVCKDLLAKTEADAKKVALSSSGSAAQRIRNLISAVERTRHKRYINCRNLYELVEVATVENWAIIGEHNRRMTAILEQIIARGIAAGEFRPGDASLAAHLVKAACILFCDPRLVVDCDQTPEPTLDQVIDFCFSALAREVDPMPGTTG